MAESPNFLNLLGNLSREHDGDVIFLTGSRNMAVSRIRNKNMQFGPCGRIAYELGYGADTVFHRTYFLLCSVLPPPC